MFDRLVLGREFFARLVACDEAIARMVAAAGCAHCKGRLHRSDYERKPRGGLIAPAGEEFLMRCSLCCAREGCRRRATPPSVRFLGRRVYLGAVVILACVVAHALGEVRESRRGGMTLRAMTGVPVRTTRRWLSWWQGPFVSTEVLIAVRARLVGVEVGRLPASILERFTGEPDEQVRLFLRELAALTTTSVGDGSRFVRGVV
jgi:hypothetical protein